MTWRVGEIVRTGNSTGVVKSFDDGTSFITITNINGEFKSGDFIVGDDSGASGILNNFAVDEEYDLNYTDQSWEMIRDTAVVLDDGSYVAIDEYFDGKPSQDYQTEHIVTI